MADTVVAYPTLSEISTSLSVPTRHIDELPGHPVQVALGVLDSTDLSFAVMRGATPPVTSPATRPSAWADVEEGAPREPWEHRSLGQGCS